VNVDAAATARALARQLLRHLPLPGSVGELAGRSVPAPGLEKRVLDAAARRFSEQGVSGTTMSQLARDAEISREWLYRHYENRNAILAALALREVQQLLEEVAERAVAADDVIESAVESFTHVVTFARGNQLLQRVAADDPQRVAAIVTGRADVVLEFAVDAVATLLTTVGEVAPDRAHLTAETLCRLALATIIAPGELRDPEVMAGYVRSLVTALLVPEPAGKR
jgi:AcrR family transcriptional regulator